MRRSAVPAALAAALLLLSACSDGSAEPSDQDGPSAADNPSSASSSPSDASGTPSSDPAAATGLELRMPHASVRGPEGWTKGDQVVKTETAVIDDDSPSVVSLGEIEAFGGTPSADELADTAIGAAPYPTPPKKLAPVQVDGVEMYHIAGRVQRLNYLEEFGAVVDDRIVTLTFQLTTRMSAAERKELVDSVVATFTWS